jgi:site-specific DNA-methyltransferase (adenine-specific)
MKNQILLGDCLTLMKDIPDKSIDMVLCDLPYQATSRNSWDVRIPIEPLWNQYRRIVRQGGVIALTATQPFSSMLVTSNPSMFKYEYVWVKTRKTNFLNANKQPLRSHEQVLIFCDGQSKYNPQGIITGKAKIRTRGGGLEGCGTNYNQAGDGYVYDKSNFPCDVLNIPSEGSTVHPTQKPIALFEYLIKTYTNEGDLVLDNAAGSFTTCLAAKNLNRRWIGIEKEEKYYQIGLKRLGIEP